MDVRPEAFREAVASFDYLVHVDLDALAKQLDERIIDGLQNGIAHKFEYTMELCWKTVKDFLKAKEGIDESSPKKVIKAAYLGAHLSEDDYLLLIQAIDDRNRLSHVYDKKHVLKILVRLPSYAAAFLRVLQRLDRPT